MENEIDPELRAKIKERFLTYAKKTVDSLADGMEEAEKFKKILEEHKPQSEELDFQFYEEMIEECVEEVSDEEALAPVAECIGTPIEGVKTLLSQSMIRVFGVGFELSETMSHPESEEVQLLKVPAPEGATGDDMIWRGRLKQPLIAEMHPICKECHEKLDYPICPATGDIVPPVGPKCPHWKILKARLTASSEKLEEMKKMEEEQ